MAKRFKMDENALELSMGMSSDFEEAVKQQANYPLRRTSFLMF